jgi:hypothetical protein
MTDTTNLLPQLRTLAQLTHVEAHLAKARTAQAGSEAVRRELEQNAKKAHERAELLERTIRDLGGIPDVTAPVVGRVGALVKSTLDQPQPMVEALLGDLALEHQLLDRARYLKVLAEAAKATAVQRVAERLIDAHTETVEWLTVVLAEDALGGPSALRPTPLQQVGAVTQRVMNLPVRVATGSLNRAVDNVSQVGTQVRDKFTAAAEKATMLAGATKDTLTAGGAASLRRAEGIAGRRGDADAARKLHSVRADAGVVDAAELPIRNYDNLNATEAVRSIKSLRDAEKVRTVLHYEEMHANRVTVVNAAQAQVAELAKQAAGIG